MQDTEYKEMVGSFTPSIVPARKKRGQKDTSILTIVRYLSDRQYKKIVKHQPVRIMVDGVIVELRQRDEGVLKEIAMHKMKIKELKQKIKT